jgi:RNA polymerase sigma-70 factor (ECF subfamily)
MSAVPDRFDDVSDAVLALAIARYDQGALAEAYRRHAGAVFGLARRLLVEPALAEEIVQEVFLRLWNDPTRYDAERGTMRSYLLTQTHGRAIDLLRADSSRRGREERDARRTAEGGPDIEREVWDLTTAEHVRRSLSALPADERAAIELAYWGGYTYREVAARLDQPEGTVKSRIRSGLQRLRRNLTEAGITSRAFEGGTP